MAKFLLAPLDPSREFIAQSEFIFRGKRIRKGDPFDPSQATTRTLRLLYECRCVGYPEDQPKAVPANDPTPDPQPAPKPALDEAACRRLVTSNNRDSLASMAAAEGVVVDPVWTKRQIVDGIARSRDGAADR